MPRHNYPKVRPYAKEFCKKHGLPYTQKPVLTAFADVVRALKRSGEIWQEAWEMSSIKQD